MKLLSKMKPSDVEVTANPRSRSAVMRVAERLPFIVAEPAAASRYSSPDKKGRK
jgi:16S rRNA (cytosine1402-N4)-methyltransferase